MNPQACGSPTMPQKKATYLPKVESDRAVFKKVKGQGCSSDLDEVIKVLRANGFKVHNTPQFLAFYKEG